MEFEWDEAKAVANFQKHGVSFADARNALKGFTVATLDTRRDYGENRTLSICIFEATTIIAVIHTDRNGITRIISARKANRNERRIFEAAVLASPDSAGISGHA
jgi:uncharacterized protein